MGWIVTAVLTILALLALEIAMELLAILLSPLRQLYGKPHGILVLILTWLVAIVAFVSGWRVAPVHSTAGILLILISPLIAALGTFSFRDLRREAAGLPPVRTSLPKRLGVKGRIVAGAFALFSVFTAVLSASVLRTLEGWITAAGAALFTWWFAYGALAGRFPRSMVEVFEIE